MSKSNKSLWRYTCGRTIFHTGVLRKQGVHRGQPAYSTQNKLYTWYCLIFVFFFFLFFFVRGARITPPVADCLRRLRACSLRRLFGPCKAKRPLQQDWPSIDPPNRPASNNQPINNQQSITDNQPTNQISYGPSKQPIKESIKQPTNHSRTSRRLHLGRKNDK